MREYAFDVELKVVVRVTAESEDAARAAIRAELEAYGMDVTFKAENGATVQLNEASVNGNSGYLFEVDGREVDNDSGDGCRTEGCDGDASAGDSWDGYCASCADKREPGE